MLPVVHQADLDLPALNALFDDLEAATRVLSVVSKGSRHVLSAPATVPLAVARASLSAGSIQAVQIRYWFENRAWCDTLTARPGGGARLVRICTDEALASAE